MFSKAINGKDIFAARFTFFLTGFFMAAWAPLVPFVKDMLGIENYEMTKIILCMGAGSVVGMVFTALIVKTLGIKKTLCMTSIILVLSVLTLCFVSSYYLTALFILSYGFALGCMDVSINIFGTTLERKYDKNLLSSMHGCYSIGEIVSLAIISLLLHIKLGVSLALVLPLATVFVIFVVIMRKVENSRVHEGAEVLTMPKGIVWVFAAIAGFILMLEGSMLDWSGLLLIEKLDISMALSSSAYMILLVFLALGRFAGDFLVKSFGLLKVVYLGLAGSVLCLMVIYKTEHLIVLYVAFALLGLCMSNILPLIVSITARQHSMPVVAAISAVSSCAYGSLLLGPAFVGFVSAKSSLSFAFFALGALGLVIMLMTFIPMIYFIRRHAHAHV